MKSIYFALFLVIICSFADGQINKPCNQDNDCDTSNKFLCINNFCRCKIGYRKPDNVGTCVLVPGTICEKHDDCENFPGAICDGNKKCICEGGFTAGKTECDKLGDRNDACNTHSICVRRTKDDNTECKNNLCVCKEGFHEGNDLKCRKTAGLEDQCINNDDCYLIVKDQNALECTADQTCKCREGFTQKEDTCNGSAELVGLSVPIMLFFIMGIIKFNF